MRFPLGHSLFTRVILKANRFVCYEALQDTDDDFGLVLLERKYNLWYLSMECSAFGAPEPAYLDP